MDGEGIEPAAEFRLQLQRRPGQLRLLIRLLRDEQHELIPAETPAKAVGLKRDALELDGVAHQHLIAPLGAEEGVDQAEVHDVAGDHDPGQIRVFADHLPGKLVKRVGIEHLGQAVVLRLIQGGPVVFVLRRPVVGGPGVCVLLLDADQLHNRVIGPAVRQPQPHGIGLDVIELIVEVLRLLMVAARPAGLGAGAVDAFLVRVPDPVAALLPADRPVLADIQDAALDGIDHTGKIVHAGNVVQEGPHLLGGILRRLDLGLRVLRRLPVRRLRALLFALDLIHPFIGLGEEIAEIVPLIQNGVHIANGIADRGKRPVPFENRAVLHNGVQLLYKFGLGQIRHNDQKFVPAVAVAVFFLKRLRQQSAGFT